MIPTEETARGMVLVNTCVASWHGSEDSQNMIPIYNPRKHDPIKPHIVIGL